MTTYRALHHRQRGAALILFSVGLLAILGMAGLALDMSHAYLNKSRLQNALDAAALSGAKTINEDGTTADAEADAINTFNEHLEGDLVDAGLVPVIEFSETLVPFSPGAVEPDARYVRARIDNFPMDMWLASVLPNVGNTRSIAGTAVAGPSPPLGSAPDSEVCDIAPILMCGTDDTDCGDGSCYGYDVNGEEEITLKTHSQSSEDWEVGPGNFQLIDIGCGSGGACVRDAIAGGYSGCATNGDTVPTEPGNTVGPVAQGFNTRFGQYSGPVSPADYPPDTVTYSNPGVFWYDDYQDRQADGNHDYTPVEEGGTGVKRRRVLTVPIGDCTGTTNGQGDITVLGFGCFFMTQPASHAGNTQEIYGQLVGSCDGEGEIPADPGPSTGPVVYKIILYKDPDNFDA